MKLTELTGVGVSAPNGHSPDDPDIVGLTADSRAVRRGFLFAALPGLRLDGRRFADDAVTRGAAAILTDDAALLDLSPEARKRIAIVLDANPRRRLALLASRFYGAQPQTIAAVTGTNGKTSVAHFTREIWSATGSAAASLGTLGVVTPRRRLCRRADDSRPGSAPRAVGRSGRPGHNPFGDRGLQPRSRAIPARRAVGCQAAAFTNLTRDHLDFHESMAAYRAAKERLFTALLAPGRPASVKPRQRRILAFGGVVQRTRPSGHRLRRRCRIRAAARSRLGHDRAVRTSCSRSSEPAYELFLPLLGRFQAMNALAALGLAIATEVPATAAIAALAKLTGVPGRMQFVAEGEAGGGIVVDYAHTPDALATVLAALRPHTPGRLVVLFGAGGDRDPGKRPLMGNVAVTGADRIYVTDDNPRSEDPAAIRRAILADAPGAIEIGDRRRAIETAIGELRPGDLLVIAGKGHETGQIVGNETLTVRRCRDRPRDRRTAVPQCQRARA